MKELMFFYRNETDIPKNLPSEIKKVDIESTDGNKLAKILGITYNKTICDMSGNIIPTHNVLMPNILIILKNDEESNTIKTTITEAKKGHWLKNRIKTINIETTSGKKRAKQFPITTTDAPAIYNTDTWRKINVSLVLRMLKMSQVK